MNLFTARLTGKMVSTEAFEANMHEMQQRVIRYRKVEKSPELKEYLELKAIVESSDFQSHKNELKNRKYKDTEEGRKTAHYKNLSGALRMKGYKYALGLPEFREFLEFREISVKLHPAKNGVSHPNSKRSTVSTSPCSTRTSCRCNNPRNSSS